MTPERIVERYEDILYEVQGKPIKARVKSCWEGENGDHIAFSKLYSHPDKALESI